MADEFMKGFALFTIGGLGWITFGGWYRTPSYYQVVQLVNPAEGVNTAYGEVGLLAGDAFFVFMLVQFLRAIPRDMEEAARVDGANTFQTLIFIVVPMLAPALISVCLFQFMWTMNDFLGPLIYISSVDKYPVSLALKLSIDTTESFQWNRILAMSVLTILPSLIVFFMAQKYFIEGISTGGVKG